MREWVPPAPVERAQQMLNRFDDAEAKRPGDSMPVAR